jgi:outer membrane biosynthesis protein TonB
MLPYWLLGAAIFLLAAAVLVITLVTVAPLRQEAARPPLKADLQLRRVEVESAAPETPDEPRVRPLERAASAIEAPVTQAVPKGEAQPQAEIAARLVSPPRPVAAPPAPAPARAEPTAPPTTAMRAPAPAPARPVEADERPYEKNADEDEARKFLARGEQLFRDGNISAARLFFRRAAENGESQAALALGATYDPNYFKDLRVLGMDADVEQARVWYRKALELGSKDAHDRLEALGGR